MSFRATLVQVFNVSGDLLGMSIDVSLPFAPFVGMAVEIPGCAEVDKIEAVSVNADTGKLTCYLPPVELFYGEPFDSPRKEYEAMGFRVCELE